MAVQPDCMTQSFAERLLMGQPQTRMRHLNLGPLRLSGLLGPPQERRDVVRRTVPAATGRDRRGFDAHATGDFGLGVVSIPAAFGCLTLARKYEGGLFAHAELMQQVVQNPHSDR